jgi:uncharacterized membrane protein YcaP (DUF421 family)
LEDINLEQNWLNQQSQTAGVQSIEEIFYAEVQKDGTLYIDKNQDVLH